MSIPQLADRQDIINWSNRAESGYWFPELIRQLIIATSKPTRIEFRTQEGAGLPGFDGYTEITTGNAFIPDGVVAWELGTDEVPTTKANKDYKKRTDNPPENIDPSQTVYISFSSRSWPRKSNWAAKKRLEGKWRDIKAFDVDDIMTWLIDAPAVHIWLTWHIGKPLEGVRDLQSWWEGWSQETYPTITPELILSGRKKEYEQLERLLAGNPQVVPIESETKDEAEAFVSAVIAQQPPNLRDTYFSKAILIDSPDTWNYYANSRRPLILIRRFNDSTYDQLAINNGHHVIVPIDPSLSIKSGIKLPRISATEALEVLKQTNPNTAKAKYFAAIIHSSLTSYRRNTSNISSKPEWAARENGASFLRLILAGGWDINKEGDIEALTQLTGKSKTDLIQLLQRWSNIPDSFFTIVGNHCRVTIPDDKWMVLAQYCTHEDLNAFNEFVKLILSERDPARALPPEERMYASIHGKVRKYSKELRTGIANSIAMLGSISTPELIGKTFDGCDPAATASLLVRDLLQDAITSREGWIDLSPVMMQFAEAAPDEFLKQVEADLKSEHPTLLILFEPKPGLMGSNYDYPNLLWALERLAWSPDYFPRVAMILADLASITSGTEIVNCPFNSLLSFFRLWFPQCGASEASRMIVLNRIVKKYPKLGWSLLLNLIPHDQDWASSNPDPGKRLTLWRDWQTEPKQPTIAEYWNSVLKVSQQLLDGIKDDLNRWVDIVDRIHKLHPATHEQVMSTLEQNADIIQDVTIRDRIGSELRKIVNKHKAFPDAEWVMPPHFLTRYEILEKKFEPIDLFARYRWMFGNHPDLGIPFRKDDYQGWEAEREQKKSESLRAIYAEHGITGILSFANSVVRPDEIGYLLSKWELDPQQTTAIRDCLGNTDNTGQLAFRFTQSSIYIKGDEWIGKYVGEGLLRQWELPKRVAALRSYPANNATFDLVDQFDEDTQREYWRSFSFYASENPDEVDHVMKSLIRFDRPRVAMDILASLTYDVNHEINLETIYSAMFACMQTAREDDPTRLASYEVKQLLIYLQYHEKGDTSRLEQLEWLFLPLLGIDTHHLQLHKHMERDPVFFVSMLGKYYLRDDESEAKEPLPDWESRAFYYLFGHWQSVPGMQSDGTLDSQHLKSWVNEVLRLLAQEKLMRGGMCALGKVLSWGPKLDNDLLQLPPIADSDLAMIHGEFRGNRIPHPAICDVIEDLAEPVLEDNYGVAIRNQRGVTWRGRGGEQERSLAEDMKKVAEAVAAKWPRVAALYRKLERSFEADAHSWDNDAAIDDIDRE
ncbi:MAG: hypothetical protein OEM52_08365 [bacterium]|nr:hypothetical protein [bacterium]